MVATDSYRLAVKRTELETRARRRARGQHPGPGAARAGRGSSPPRESRRPPITLLPNQAVFEAGAITLTTRLIDGQFPNFRQLLPESYEHDVRLPRAEFLDVARRVSQLAQRNAPLRLSFAAGRADRRGGDAGRRRRARDDAGRLRGRAAGDRLQPRVPQARGSRASSGDEVLLRLISPLRPGLLQPVENEDFRYLVMPIRLNV